MFSSINVIMSHKERTEIVSAGIEMCYGKTLTYACVVQRNYVFCVSLALPLPPYFHGPIDSVENFKTH